MHVVLRDYFLIGAYDEPYLRVTNHIKYTVNS